MAERDHAGNRAAVVVGGSQGIGRRVVNSLTQSGWQVTVFDRVSPWAAAADGPIVARDRVDFVEVDLREGAQIAEAAAHLDVTSSTRWLGVFSTRLRDSESLLDQTASNFELQMQLSVLAPFLFAQSLCRVGARHRIPGRLVWIGSVAATLSGGESAAYHAAKGALESLSRYFAVEGPRSGVDVTSNLVRAGLIVQERHRARYDAPENQAWRETCEAYQPAGVVGSDLDVAELVCWLANEAPQYLNGATIELSGGATLQDQFSLIRRYLD